MNTFQSRSRNLSHDIVYEPSVSYDSKNVIVGTPSLISELQYERTNDDDKDPSYRWTSDVTLLFNQERLADSLSAEQIRQWLIGLNHPNNNVRYDNISDELILQTIKSRHIQSMSELKAWSDEILESAESLMDEYNLLEKEMVIASQSPASIDGSSNTPPSGGIEGI